MYVNTQNPLVEIHTADIHFGAMDPKLQYDLLMERMIDKIRPIHFDAFFINGDLFHHKFMSNSDVIMYALLFIDEVVKLCLQNNATLVLLHGTGSHDADQLKLFYRYIQSGIDIRIVETIGFETIKGTRVLCIPEEYGKGYQYYENYLFYSGDYDMVVMHGNIKGAIYGLDKADLDAVKNPVFDINCFTRCNGPIMCGHVHVAGCYANHIYYSGSPLRWKFGEEQDKGFIILVYQPGTHQYYTHFETIESFRYDTVNLDDMINSDPKEVIQHIIYLKSQGIDFIKVRFSESNTTTDLIKQYFNTKTDIIIDVEDSGFKQTVESNKNNDDKLAEYGYILDNGLSPHEIFVQYVNKSKGEQFISVDELLEILTT
jgi:DNA repair exonuclease SbcCD nuclease subunit